MAITEAGSAISIDATGVELIYQRRAVRDYRSEVVAEAEVRGLLDAAVHAPTAMHQEPWKFIVIQDRSMLRWLSDRAKAMAVAQASEHGNLLKAPGANGDGIASPMADPEFNIFYDAGTLVVICAHLANDFVVADCWLAAENLMLAAVAHGLGSCCIGFAVPVLNTPDIKAELGIPADVRAVAPIILGVPQSDLPMTPRKPAAVITWIR